MADHGSADNAARDPDGPMIVLLAAVAENGVIGSDGEIPWYYPADLAHFKETTMGHPVIMGRRTYESIAERLDGPLPGRTNVVLSRSGFMPAESGDDGAGEGETSVVVAGGVEGAIEAAAETGSDVAYVAGGATVYEQFLPLAARMIITEVPETPEGDTRFPEWNRDVWTVIDRREIDELAFVTYERTEAGRADQGTS
ncbi:dihydrofolate reductase [Halorhabdus amylolytica]|uniref:dihydrofolate reductase n=1 Tax=Halorhabdus amylolytica TaxID=2559573 RepID=UPI0010AB235D|nr:dihydrofolate reductase [Halorhabdus amylolytica]